MALSGVHQIITKYRNRTSDELNQCLINLCRLLSSFSTIDKQTDAIVVSFRELYLILLTNRSDKRVPENVIILCLSALQDLKAIHPQLLTIAVACLAEVSPSETVKIDAKSLESLDVSRIPVFLHLLRQQDLPAEFGRSNCVLLAKYLNDAVTGPAAKQSVLAFFVNLFAAEDEKVLYEDCYDLVCWSVANWLINASTFDEAQHEKSKRTTKSVELLSVTELDGSTPSEAFTVLCLARAYAEDQQMSITSFMLLYEILLTLPLKNMMEVVQDETLAMPLATLQGRVRYVSLEEVAFDYCLRLLKQSEVRPLKSSYDCELQDVVLSEAVRIMDLLCSRDKKLVRKAFRSVQDVNDRVVRKIHNMQLLLITFRFMLNHGDSADFELDNLCHFMCCDFLPGSGLLDNIFASEFIALLRDNRSLVRNRTKMFSRYFPSLFKVLAWNPRANMHLFVELLEVITTSTTYLEIFHMLIDLPCTSAALEVALCGESSFFTSIRQLATDKYKDARLKFYFEFFLRNEGGRGETPDHLTEFHAVLSDVTAHPRVVYCSQAISALMSIYFSTSTVTRLDRLNSKKLAIAILDRMHSLYPSFTDLMQMQMVMADGFCSIIARMPNLLIEIYEKVTDYILKNHFMYATFLTSLVWCIGERIDGRVGLDNTMAMSKFYDVVELLTYDIIKTQSKSLVHNPQAWSMDLFQASLNTMTRLGALSKDLTRRTVICLNNICKKTREHPDQQRLLIIEQINSLIKLLELPSVTDIVMNLSISPEPEVLEAIKGLKSVADEYQELSAAQSP
ncbi:AP-5 complex subunit zeta-1-like [Paramacrobiotus metropolitanus]|uniref:AP-5 complex subunit zeta-1-like n=1 Tax=Paramacrobiotus metropolitanus TaxID=2943436 RepID=UPI0024458755|nr:AP-5 complex subunit zeta-1-like [Paramacrobiotus metropolitanus]